MRTTIDIDTPILKEVKALQKKDGQSLGRLISDPLAQALRARKTGVGKSATPGWVSKPMGARMDLGGKEALYAAMERPRALSRRCTLMTGTSTSSCFSTRATPCADRGLQTSGGNAL